MMRRRMGIADRRLMRIIIGQYVVVIRGRIEVDQLGGFVAGLQVVLNNLLLEWNYRGRCLLLLFVAFAFRWRRLLYCEINIMSLEV